MEKKAIKTIKFGVFASSVLAAVILNLCAYAYLISH